MLRTTIGCPDMAKTLLQVFNSFNALGTFAFAYAAHNVVGPWALDRSICVTKHLQDMLYWLASAI